jgi:hypothetical protein
MSKLMEQVRSDQILHAISQLHMRRGDQFFAEVKNGPTQMVAKGELLIIDGLAIAKSWTKPMFTGYEIKVSRSDFLRDAKWHLYAEYCHRLVLACPKGMIQANELPDFAGLVWYNPDTKTLTTKKRPVTRYIDINQNMLYYIIMSKLEPDRHPYFKSRTEQWQAWLDGKLENRDLGYKTGAKVAQTIEDQQRELGRLRIDQTHAASVRKQLDEVTTIMRDAGIDTLFWQRALEVLRQRLSGGSNELPHNISARMRELLVGMDKLKEAINDLAVR